MPRKDMEVNKSKSPAPSSASLAVLFLRLAFTALVRSIVSPFKGPTGASTYFKDVMYAVIRKQMRITSVPQSRYLNKTTCECYISWTESKSLKPVTEELENDARAHWLGDKNATRVIVYYHGGGYTLPLVPAYFDYLSGLKDLLTTPEDPVAVVVLAYTLTPEASYPTQLIQASTLLKHLLETKSPSQLTLMGDSAGGNLTIAVLSNILHPHPDARVPRIELSEPLKGLVVLSPWVSFENYASYVSNADSDMLDERILNPWSDRFIGTGNTHDAYSEPLRASRSWWNDASKSVSQVMIWGGAKEILIESIEAFAEKFKNGWQDGGGKHEDLSVVITAEHAHVEPLVDIMLQYKTKGQGALAIENWFKSQI